MTDSTQVELKSYPVNLSYHERLEEINRLLHELDKYRELLKKEMRKYADAAMRGIYLEEVLVSAKQKLEGIEEPCFSGSDCEFTIKEITEALTPEE